MVEYTAQSMVLAIIPKVPALCSMIGSTYIVHNVITVPQKRKTMYNRIMLGMSVCDILASHAYFLGTFIIPRGSGGPFGPVYWAFGNDATCSYGGFFNQFAVSSPIYNTSLSIYYLLQIVCTWTPKELERVEPVLHGFPIAFAIATSIYALVKDMYGNVFWTCWINPDPPQPKFRYFQWSFLFAPVWICVIINSVIMTLLWYKMRSLEEKITGKYQLDDEQSRRPEGSDDEDDEGSRQQRRSSIAINKVKKESRQSSKIAVQGMLYVGAFYVTWFFPTISRITDLLGTGHFAVQALDTGLLPMQGLLNVLIYLRPKYLFYRRKHPDITFWEIFRIVNDPRQEAAVITESQYYRQSAISNMFSGRKSSVCAGLDLSEHDLRLRESILAEARSRPPSRLSNSIAMSSDDDDQNLGEEDFKSEIESVAAEEQVIHVMNDEDDAEAGSFHEPSKDKSDDIIDSSSTCSIESNTPEKENSSKETTD